jgi:hypothetical protein
VPPFIGWWPVGGESWDRAGHQWWRLEWRRLSGVGWPRGGEWDGAGAKRERGGGRAQEASRRGVAAGVWPEPGGGDGFGSVQPKVGDDQGNGPGGLMWARLLPGRCGGGGGFNGIRLHVWEV